MMKIFNKFEWIKQEGKYVEDTLVIENNRAATYSRE